MLLMLVMRFVDMIGGGGRRVGGGPRPGLSSLVAFWSAPGINGGQEVDVL